MPETGFHQYPIPGSNPGVIILIAAAVAIGTPTLAPRAGPRRQGINRIAPRWLTAIGIFSILVAPGFGGWRLASEVGLRVIAVVPILQGIAARASHGRFMVQAINGIAIAGPLQKLIPRGFLQPALQAFLKTATHLLKLTPQAAGLLTHLLPPATGSAQQLLAHAGAG